MVLKNPFKKQETPEEHDRELRKRRQEELDKRDVERRLRLLQTEVEVWRRNA